MSPSLSLTSTSSGTDGHGVQIVQMLFLHPWIVASFALFVLCTITRVRSGLQAKTLNGTEDGDGPRTVPIQPYWIPWLGHGLSLAFGYQEYVDALGKRTKSRIYGLRAGGRTINVITSPSLTKQVLDKVGLPTDSHSLVFYLLKTFFGDRGACEKLAHLHQELFWGDLTKPLTQMQREPWLGQAVGRTARMAGDQVYNLVSGNESWVDQEPWERVSETEIVSVDDQGNFVAETNLHHLLRDWVGHIATTLLMGRSFLENNPDALQDLWLMDSRLTKFMLGLPAVMVPGLLPATFARERVRAAVQEHHEALLKILDNKDPGTKYDNVNDVPPIIWDRVKALKTMNADLHTYGAGNLVILWAMNVNANQLVFWTVYNLYGNPKLLAEVRKEIEPYVCWRPNETPGLRIQEAPKLDIDTQAIYNKCPLLKGSFYEAMRFEVAATSFRSVLDDFTITESAEDAAIAGKSRPETYLIKKGDVVLVPSMAHQKDDAYWPDPTRFDPRRFFSDPTPNDDEEEVKPEQKQDDVVSVSHKSLRAFGGGKNMCKGRYFAEREVLIFVASVIATWDMDLVDQSQVTRDGWKHPGHVPTSATMNPRKKVRVKMWRRKV